MVNPFPVISSQMKSIIVGTAGHIDHGKTALVKALTGIDADRLEEEKRRGITIDLGFAHMDLAIPNGGRSGETLRLGFVDVPGHERFVRNMLAGVGGIDLVLLVIAADEAIKPQTREHFDILQLLGVQRGITVLTKSDAVDAETLEVVRLEVEEFLRGTFLEAPKSPIIAASSLTGAGLDELKRAIVAKQPRCSRGIRAIARLPIDRVFTMKGFGTVVTGTLVAGTIRREEELEVFPTGRRVRVRGVQVHGQAADAAIAGQRTALNLAGASTEDLSRGMTLAPPETFEDYPARGRFVAPAVFGGAPVERPGPSAFSLVHHGNCCGGFAPRDKEDCSGRAGVCAAQTAEAGAAPARRPFYPAAVFAGSDNWRWNCAGRGADSTHAGTKRLPEDSGGGNAEAILTARIERGISTGISMSRADCRDWLVEAVVETRLDQLVRTGTIVRTGGRFLHAPAFDGLKLSMASGGGSLPREKSSGGWNQQRRVARAGGRVHRKFLRPSPPR
jgi:small GTP-binding protein